MKSGIGRTAVFFFVLSIFFGSLSWNFKVEADELYKEFQPNESSRRRESIEWTIIYMFNTNDLTKPRALLIGDSICNAYQSTVREELEGKVNITYWADSKCVTDPQYFEELNMVLSGNRYDVITFNNGLHSLSSDRHEWEVAYRQAVLFIREKAPEAKLLLVMSTPTENSQNSAVSKALGDYTKKVADEFALDVIDLYQVIDEDEDKQPWSDGVHFKQPFVRLLGQTIADAVLTSLD